jgi:hypothetical protein
LESVSDEMVSVRAERSLILLDRVTVQGISKNLTINIGSTR